MDIIINKDFTKFKSEKWKGLHTRQIVMAIVLLICIGGAFFFFIYLCKVPLLLSSMMTMPPVAAAVIIGYCEIGGVSFIAFVIRRRNRKKLLYRSIRIRKEVLDFNDTLLAPLAWSKRLNALRDLASPAVNKVVNKIKKWSEKIRFLDAISKITFKIIKNQRKGKENEEIGCVSELSKKK